MYSVVLKGDAWLFFRRKLIFRFMTSRDDRTEQNYLFAVKAKMKEKCL